MYTREEAHITVATPALEREMRKAMREILFKAKRVDNGKWLEGYYQKRFDDFGNIQHLIFYSKSATVWGYAEIYIDTLCQYTGLKDKNGKQIWENDIVRCQDCIGVVKWNETHLAYTILAKNKDGNMQYYFMSEALANDIEVIGNTFDNPELLESEECNGCDKQ